MARSMDLIITNNLDCVIRHMETGSRLIQKYIQNQCLLQGKKFDFRYWVMVRSFAPLDAYVFNDFSIRSSSGNFSLDFESMMDVKKQFTVIYKIGEDRPTFTSDEFKKVFEEEHGLNYEKDIEVKIYDLIRDTLKAAVLFKPQIQNNNCRALYGFDFILNDQHVPKILEVTFSPDITFVNESHPDFIEDVFKTLYKGEPSNAIKL